MFARLCAKTPVIASSAIDSATCAVASAVRKRATPFVVVCLAPYACNAFPGLIRIRPRTGRSPTASADATAMPIATSAAVALKLTSGAAAAIPGTPACAAQRQQATGRLRQGRRQREHERLGELQRSEAPARRSQRRAQRDLAASRRGPKQDEPATLAQHSSSTTPLTANSSSRLLRAGASMRLLVCPRAPGSSTSVLERNASRCCSSTPTSSGASTSLRIAPIERIHRGCGRFARDARLEAREEMGPVDSRDRRDSGCRGRPASLDAGIVIGTKTLGRAPTAVPWNPRGATPTIVSGTSLTVSVRPRTPGSPPNSLCQYAGSTRPIRLVRRRDRPRGPSSRPSAGLRPSSEK